MIKRAFLVCLILSVLIPCSCRKRAKEPEAGAASAPRVTVRQASWREPPMTSESLRLAWNESAAELFDIRWSSDRQRPWKIDIEAGDISMPSSRRARFGQPASGPLSATPELIRAIDLTGERLEEKRRRALASALAEKAEAHSSFSASGLGDAEAAVLVFLVEAASIVDDLFLLQNHPASLEFARELIGGGDLDSIRFFRRAGGPHSARCGDPLYASAMGNFPDRMIGAAMWPDGMGLNLKEELSARGDGAKPNPFLSPYTVVKRTDAGDLMWMPYAAYPPFAGLVHSLSRRLDDASIVTGADAGLARLLSLYAKALSGTDAYPFDEAFGAFASYKGRLKVLVGPYGTGRDPWGAKGFYGLVVGIQNETAEAVVAKATAIFPALEAAIARMAGEAYTPRQAGSEPSLDAMDVIIASGFSGGDEPLFLELSPDGLPHGEGEARKRLIAVNHHDAKLPLLKAVANASLAPALAVRVDADGLRLFTILSTLADDVGLKAGAAAPADLAVLSRVKADAGGALAARLLAEGGAIGQGELFRFYAAYIATLVDRMRGLNESDAKAAAFELSYLAWHGALREQGARLAVNPDRLAPAVEAMLGETVRAFASGGGDGAAALLASYTSKIPDSVSISLESLSAAGTPRDAVVNYRVAGTER